jgi:transcriptional regulator with XRE-family HTH domain
MNLTELAEALDVSLATVSRISSGDRRPSLDLMYKIEDVLIWPFEAQADEIRCGTYAQVFTDKMERRQARRRDADPSTMRSVSGTSSDEHWLQPLEAGGENRKADRVGEGPRPIDWRLDISHRWYVA